MGAEAEATQRRQRAWVAELGHVASLQQWLSVPGELLEAAGPGWVAAAAEGADGMLPGVGVMQMGAAWPGWRGAAGRCCRPSCTAGAGAGGSQHDSTAGSTLTSAPHPAPGAGHQRV
jgi:hypothetical protein